MTTKHYLEAQTASEQADLLLAMAREGRELTETMWLHLRVAMDVIATDLRIATANRATAYRLKQQEMIGVRITPPLPPRAKGAE